MAILQEGKKTIRGRLGLISLVMVLVFALIAISLHFASRGVRSKVDEIVEHSLQDTIENSQHSRRFGLLNARLEVLKSTFNFEDQWFEIESQEILDDINQLEMAVSGSSLEGYFEQLKKQYADYLEHRRWVNYLLFWRSAQDDAIGELFSFLREIIAAETIKLTVEGEKPIILSS